MNNTLHFGVRGGGEEHRNSHWGDIGLHCDEELKLDYLEFNELQTKTRTGEEVREIRQQRPTM